MRLIFDGLTPALAHPSLQQNRLKREIIRQEKLLDNPAGLGVVGVQFEYFKDQAKPLQERYIHCLLTELDSAILILTFNPFLASLVHEAQSIQVDMTFKWAVDDLNEWEIVIWYSAVNKAITIGRAYTNRADRAHYKKLFNNVQEVILKLTGKPMRFKRLSCSGNILSMNVDLEAAQVLGASDSFLPTNEPDYSGIQTHDPEEIVQYFIKACYAHVKRPIHNFKSLVSYEDYRRLLDFPYIQSDKELNSFEQFVQGTNVKKIQDWWSHKCLHCWVLPMIMCYKTRLNHDDWDITPATTNAGEGQHHWTNQHTSVHLSLLEAILSARLVDEKTAQEIQAMFEAGTLSNSHNNVFHCMVRNVTWASTSACKSQTVAKKNDQLTQLRKQIEDEKTAQKLSLQCQKALQEQLGASQGGPKPMCSQIVRASKSASGADLDASSCGRVQSSQKGKGKAREISDPYPITRASRNSISTHRNISESTVAMTSANNNSDVQMHDANMLYDFTEPENLAAPQNSDTIPSLSPHEFDAVLLDGPAFDVLSHDPSSACSNPTTAVPSLDSHLDIVSFSLAHWLTAPEPAAGPSQVSTMEYNNMDLLVDPHLDALLDKFMEETGGLIPDFS